MLLKELFGRFHNYMVLPVRTLIEDYLIAISLERLKHRVTQPTSTVFRPKVRINVAMHIFTAIVSLATLAVLTDAQLNLPQCAGQCFSEAIGNTSCSDSDFYCQCTSGAATIQGLAIPCLCHSECSSTDLISVIQDTNRICSSAVASHGQQYTAATVGLGACATASTGTVPASATSGGNGNGDSNGGSQTTNGGSQGGQQTGSASQSGGSNDNGGNNNNNNDGGSSSTAENGAQQTGNAGAINKVVYRDVVLGIAGLAAIAL